MADVFISYARADRGRVRLVALGLAAEGFSVWWDPEIQPGKKFDDVIRRELEASAAVVTCWTRAAAKSKWVLAETSFADGQKKLAPAVLQNCDPPIPYNMLQSADLTRWRGHADDPEWVALLARVKTLVDAKKRPVVAAAPPPGEAEAAQAPALSADAAPTPAPVIYDAERYMPSNLRGRAGGGGLGRAALAVAATAALTFGVLAAPEIIARVRSAIEMEPAPPLPPPPPPPALTPDPATFELAPTAEPLDAATVESQAVETPTAANPPVVKPAPEPKPRPKPPHAGPTPVSTTPLPPAPDPRKPWTDLDACTQTLAARCAWRAPRAGFADDGTITAQEGAFLRALGVETRQINAEVARQCQAVAHTATATVDATGGPTTLGTACGVKQAAQTLNPAAKAALAAGAAIVFGQIANGGRSGDQKPPSRQAPTRPLPTTGPN